MQVRFREGGLKNVRLFILSAPHPLMVGTSIQINLQKKLY